jgi:cytidylate kinase
MLADRLGVPFVDRAIPAAVSNRLSVSLDEALAREEPPPGTLSRVIAGLAPATMALYGGIVSPELAQNDEAFRTATERVLRDYASTGAIILGRGAAVVLHEVAHVTHVRLDGPRELRILQAMRLQRIDRVKAERQLRNADLSREAYVRHWYHADARDPSLYHLVLDSTSLTLQACVELIALASAERLGVTPDASRAKPDQAI